MPASETVTPARRWFLRLGLPVLILALAGLAMLAVWLWPGEDMEQAYRVVGTVMILQLTTLLLVLWLLVFSGLRWLLRLGILFGLAATIVIAAVTSIRSYQLTGDMVPKIEFRWDPTAEDRLEAHRREQARGVALTLPDLTVRESDWPEYRGRARDGIALGPPLARDWKAQRPAQFWRQPIGGGYAAFAVAGNVAVTIEQRRDQEAVVCYDAATGRERWVYPYPTRFQETLGGDGPRATPSLADGVVYSLARAGKLVCLDGITGEARWTTEILKDNGNVAWGMSGSPLVYDNVVVVNPGTQSAAAAGRALVAYDRKTGNPVWSAGSTRVGYSSPMLATLAGRRQVLLFDGEGLGGYDAATGQELWRYPWITNQGINVAQPLVLAGDRVFVSSGYSVGCALLQVAESNGTWSAKPLWANKLMRCKFTSPVAYQGSIYGLDDGMLVCLDEKTGQRQWKGERYGHGQLLLSGDLLVILSESGELALVEATPTASHELGRFAALEGKTWNYPALANGLVFVRNNREMASYDLRTQGVDGER